MCPPLALVAFQDVEGLNNLWYPAKRRSEYRLYKIYDNYRISLLEFLDLPRAIIDEMIDELAEEREIEASALAAAKQKSEK